MNALSMHRIHIFSPIFAYFIEENAEDLEKNKIVTLLDSLLKAERKPIVDSAVHTVAALSRSGKKCFYVVGKNL